MLHRNLFGGVYIAADCFIRPTCPMRCWANMAFGGHCSTARGMPRYIFFCTLGPLLHWPGACPGTLGPLLHWPGACPGTLGPLLHWPRVYPSTPECISVSKALAGYRGVYNSDACIHISSFPKGTTCTLRLVVTSPVSTE